MSCGCSAGSCLGCACHRAGRGCSSDCHGGRLNNQCQNIRLRSGLDVNAMPIAQVKQELIKRELFNLDDSGPQLKALLLRTLKEEEAIASKSSSSSSSSSAAGGKSKKAKGVDEMDDDDDDDDDGGGSELDAASVARTILASQSDPLSILNVLSSTPAIKGARAALHSLALSSHGGRITLSSPSKDMKKLFRYLAAQIHPDKLSRKFDKATQAFQALVQAYEQISQGGVSKKGAVSLAIDLTKARSNANCWTTPVFCPRCQVEWNLPSDGLDKYSYSIFMLGLQSFHCSTCLLQFGCVSAIHRCPSCRSPASTYEYEPSDYSRQLSCPNPKCARKFGFRFEALNDRRARELLETIKEEQEMRIKKQASMDARGDRMAKRKAMEEEARVEQTVEVEDEDEEDEDEEDDSRGKKKRKGKTKQSKSQAYASYPAEERAFIMGLANCCPRCGWSPEGSGKKDSGAAVLQNHVDSCTDKAAHSRYQAIIAAKEKRAQEKAEKATKERDAQSGQVWRALGAKKEQAWLMTDGAVRNQLLLTAPAAAADASSSSAIDNFIKLTSTLAPSAGLLKEEARPTSSVKGALVLHQSANTSSSSSSSSSTSSAAAARAAMREKFLTLPSNLHSMPRDQILRVLGSHSLLRGDESELALDQLRERIDAMREGREEETIEEYVDKEDRAHVPGAAESESEDEEIEVSGTREEDAELAKKKQKKLKKKRKEVEESDQSPAKKKVMTDAPQHPAAAARAVSAITAAPVAAASSSSSSSASSSSAASVSAPVAALPSNVFPSLLSLLRPLNLSTLSTNEVITRLNSLNQYGWDEPQIAAYKAELRNLIKRAVNVVLEERQKAKKANETNPSQQQQPLQATTQTQ